MEVIDITNLDKLRFKQFYIAMTNRCNLKCIMCTTTTHSHELEKELRLEQWKIIIDNITRFRIETIGFGGGEPFIRKEDLAQLAKIVASKKITVNIVTNATLLTSDFLNNIIDYKEKIIFLLSLDGLEEENDRIRGRGVFKKVTEAANLLQKYKWPFFITSVLMPDNFFGFVKFLKFIIENYPTVCLDIQPVIPHNEIYYYRNKLELNEDQLIALRDILSFVRNNEDKIKLCRPLKIIDKYRDYFTNTLQSENQCKIGTESFNINLRGNIWICGKELEYPLHRYKLEEVLVTNEYTTEMKRVQNCKSPCLAGLVI